MKLSEINLEENPFDAITPTPSPNLIWAGMSKLKDQFINIYEQTFESKSRKVVLNWGKYGSGKTHAAYYFANNRISDVDDERMVNLYIRTSKDGSIANTEFVKNLFDSKGIDYWKESIEEAIEEHGKVELTKIISEKIQSEEFTNAIIRLGEKQQPKLFLSKYIFGKLDAREMKKLNITRPLKTDTEYVKFLSGIIVAATSTSKDKRVFIWIDEFEDVIHYTSKQYTILSQLIRDLVDTVNQKMVLFINMTLAETEEETVTLLLGRALWDRINKKISFNQIDKQIAFEYCKDLIQHAQIEKKDTLEPFSEETIKLILDTISQEKMTPRDINKIFYEMIDFALDNELDLSKKETVKSYLEQL